MGTENLEVKLFKALSHPVRLAIVKDLLVQERCVCELNEHVDFSQSNLSQHLKILKDAGILESQKDGLRVSYHVYNSKIVSLIRLTEEIVHENLESFL